MLKTIFRDEGHVAQVTADGTCCVHRVTNYHGAEMSSYAGEKRPQQSWGMVRLVGVPKEVRRRIAEAWVQEMEARSAQSA